MTRTGLPFAALSFAILCGGLATSAAAAIGHGLQPPGSFHGGEVVARHGEHWLALRLRSGGAELLAVRVAVERVHDVVVDDEGQATGEAVSAIGLEDAVMLMRGPGLEPGDVIVAERFEAGATGDQPNLHLRLGERDYRLDTHCIATPANDSNELSTYECTIELSDGKQRQSLLALAGHRPQGSGDARIQFDNDASPYLVFAGDLDRDGHLDLIFDTTDHYNVSRPTLFLSGAAGKDDMLRAVASHDAVGC